MHPPKHTNCPRQHLPQTTPLHFSSKRALIAAAFISEQHCFFWPRVKPQCEIFGPGWRHLGWWTCINSVVTAIQWMTYHSKMNRHSYISTQRSCISGSQPRAWHTILCYQDRLQLTAAGLYHEMFSVLAEHNKTVWPWFYFGKFITVSLSAAYKQILLTVLLMLGYTSCSQCRWQGQKM